MSDEEARADAPVRKGGTAIAVFAMLLALLALGVAGYPYYLDFSGSGATKTTGEFEALRVAQQRQAEELARLVTDTANMESRLTQQMVALEKAGSDVASVSALPPSVLPERALKLGEAELLLRSANDQLLVTHDVSAALAMLGAASSRLDQVDDQALVDVRSTLSREIVALRDIAGPNLDATYRRLQALMRAIPDLPARGGKFTSPPAPPVNTDTVAPSVASSAWAKFLSMFAFHREAGLVRPPLGPDQAAYLRLNMGLMVQTAELALLRNDAAVYEQSLQSLRDWLDDYLDTTAPEVVKTRAEIDQLLAIRLGRSLPDTSGSLIELRRMLHPIAPAASVATPNASAESSTSP